MQLTKMMRVFLGCMLMVNFLCSVNLAMADEKPVIVIVHGAWGGGWAFGDTADLLEKKGFRVYRPTLTGLGERHHLLTADTGLDTHIQDVVSVLEFEQLENIVLLGHSYGGIVISGVAEKVPERIARLIYLDALLLEDGESWRSVSADDGQWMLSTQQGNGFVAPWVNPDKPPPGDVPHPVKTFTDTLSLNNPKAANLPAEYILTVEPGNKAEDDDFYRFSQRAKTRGWRVSVLVADHNPQWSEQQKFADLVAELAR